MLSLQAKASKSSKSSQFNSIQYNSIVLYILSGKADDTAFPERYFPHRVRLKLTSPKFVL